nr:DUF2919 domain-containing protein [Neptunicella marina]
MLFPLECYDEQGRLIPPKALIICHLFLLRAFLVLVIALATRQSGNDILKLLYPLKSDFYLGLMLGIPPLLSLVIISYRQKLWKNNLYWPFNCCKPLLIISLIADLFIHLQQALGVQWAFSWLLALVLVGDLLWVLYLLNSRYLKGLFADWRLPNPQSQSE